MARIGMIIWICKTTKRNLSNTFVVRWNWIIGIIPNRIGRIDPFILMGSIWPLGRVLTIACIIVGVCRWVGQSWLFNILVRKRRMNWVWVCTVGTDWELVWWALVRRVLTSGVLITNVLITGVLTIGVLITGVLITDELTIDVLVTNVLIINELTTNMLISTVLNRRILYNIILGTRSEHNADILRSLRTPHICRSSWFVERPLHIIHNWWDDTTNLTIENSPTKEWDDLQEERPLARRVLSLSVQRRTPRPLRSTKWVAECCLSWWRC